MSKMSEKPKVWFEREVLPDLADEVAARTREMFAEKKIYQTRAATGLVVYVSLYEQMARVQGDAAVVDKLGQEALDELAGMLVQSLAEGHPADA